MIPSCITPTSPIQHARPTSPSPQIATAPQSVERNIAPPSGPKPTTPTQAALQTPETAPAAPNLEAFRQRVLKEWTDQITVDGWRKWHTPFSQATAAVSEFCVQAANIKPGMRVLDLASGSGEPAITAARAAGSTGHVVATDLSEGMLAIAEEQAQTQGVRNMSFVPASMEALPFDDDKFDRITCRWGLMFVTDHVKALREIDRVLKPSGRVVIVAWGAPTQPFFAPLHALLKRNLLPAPVPGAPTPLKFSQVGSLTTAMQAAGLRRIEESAPTLPLDWPGTPESLFQWFYDIAAPFRGLFDSLDTATFDAVKADVYDSVRPLVDHDTVRVGAHVAVGIAQSSKD